MTRLDCDLDYYGLDDFEFTEEAGVRFLKNARRRLDAFVKHLPDGIFRTALLSVV